MRLICKPISLTFLTSRDSYISSDFVCCIRYYKHEDIMCHELAHAIHLLAANLVIPGFAKRLKDVYGRAMSKGMWIFRNGQKSYAATNEQEYWVC